MSVLSDKVDQSSSLASRSRSSEIKSAPRLLLGLRIDIYTFVRYLCAYDVVDIDSINSVYYGTGMGQPCCRKMTHQQMA